MDKYSLFWFSNLLGWWHHRNDLFILYYIIYIILFIQDHIYMYNILYTGLHILWCEHVSSRIASSRLFLNEHSDIIHFTQINMHHSNLPFVCCCRYKITLCNLTDQFNIQSERNIIYFAWMDIDGVYQILLRHTNNIITKSVCISISQCMETVTPSEIIHSIYSTCQMVNQILHLKRWYSDYSLCTVVLIPATIL